MFIKNCLTALNDLHLLRPDSTVKDALDYFQSHQLETLPVADEAGQFVGICGYNTILKTLLNQGKDLQATDQLLVKDCLDSKVHKLTLDDIFEATLPIIVRYPFVPIVDENNHLLGIVKRGDVELALESMFALRVPGVRLLLASLEIPGEFERIIDTIRKHKHNLLAALSFDAGDRYARRVLVKIDYADDIQDIINELEEMGFRVLAVHKQ
jgi:acetoin utilization protein AcuB